MYPETFKNVSRLPKSDVTNMNSSQILTFGDSCYYSFTRFFSIADKTFQCFADSLAPVQISYFLWS